MTFVSFYFFLPFSFYFRCNFINFALCFSLWYFPLNCAVWVSSTLEWHSSGFSNIALFFLLFNNYFASKVMSSLCFWFVFFTLDAVYKDTAVFIIFVSRVGVVVSGDGWCDVDWTLGCDVLVSEGTSIPSAVGFVDVDIGLRSCLLLIVMSWFLKELWFLLL